MPQKTTAHARAAGHVMLRSETGCNEHGLTMTRYSWKLLHAEACAQELEAEAPGVATCGGLAKTVRANSGEAPGRYGELGGSGRLPAGIRLPPQKKQAATPTGWHCSWCREGKLCNWCGECGDGMLYSITRLGYARGTLGCKYCIRRKSGQETLTIGAKMFNWK